MVSQIQVAAQACGRPGSSLLSARRSMSPQASGSSNTGTLFEFKVVAYKPKRLNEADQRAGVRPTSAPWKPPSTTVRINLANLSLPTFKEKVVELAEKQREGCGILFQDADSESMVEYFGFVAKSPIFPKTRPHQIGDPDEFERFKAVVSRHIGKEMGIHAIMIDQHAKPRMNRGAGNANEFDRAMLADDPAADPARIRALALDEIGANPSRESIVTQLTKLHGNNRRGHREGMTCYNVEDAKVMMPLTYPMIDIWADSIVAREEGVTKLRPPIGKTIEFEWKLKSKSVPGIPETANLEVPGAAHPAPPISPAPQPYPPFEDYLGFCHIGPDDHVTRGVVTDLGFVQFDEFFSNENSIDFLKVKGMKHAPAVRLSTKAAEYRNHLKKNVVNPAL